MAPASSASPWARSPGGERNRLTLAIALARPSNLLILDEPTNDLDVETLDLLEDMLAEYDGTLIVVSHDRAFIDGVATSVIGPVGEGRWLETPGGYSDHILQRPPPPPTRPPPPAPAAAPRSPDRPSAKLSYKDVRRIDEIERRLPLLDAEIAALEAELADPALFSRNPGRFEAAAKRLAGARAEKDADETEWLDLAEKRDALARP